MNNKLNKRLETFTDLNMVKDLFQQQLPGCSNGRLVIKHIKIIYVRYRVYPPKKNPRKALLSVCYELEFQELGRKRHGRQMIYASIYHPDFSQKEFQKFRNFQLSQPEYGRALIHLSTLDTIVWAFPNDPKLLHLPEVIDSKKVRQYLPYHFLPEGVESSNDIKDIAVEVVRYKPEIRCTTRYHLRWGQADKGMKITLYGKTFTHDEGKNIYHIMERLWKRSLLEPGGFIVTQPLGYNEAIKTVWQRALPGSPLIDLMDKHNYKNFLESVAKGLANLHKSDIPSPFRSTISDRLYKIRNKIGKLMNAYPSLEGTLQSILKDLEKRADRLSSVFDGLIHQDFLLKQLVVHEDKLGVFDFDGFAIGDPIQDIACFIVDLYFQDYDEGLANLMAITFYHAYKSQVKWEIPRDRINWHIQIEFISKAHYFHSRKQLQPEFKNEIQHIIALTRKGITLDGNLGN